jgi:hypothetical protein
MPMPPYLVMCYAIGCPREAVFKIAARWSDGITEELKTYYLACTECLQSLFDEAMRKRDRCRLTSGETLEVPGVYRLNRGARDRRLERCTDLERQFGEIRA